MPYFYVLNGRHRHKVFKVGEKPAGEVVGLRDDADVILKDPWVSWTHAKVLKDGERVVIEDLGSTNGTYVNCEKVHRRALGEDDVVFLGRTHLLFVQSDRPPSAPPASARSGSGADVVRGDATVRMVVPGTPQKIPALDMSRDSAISSMDEAPAADEAEAAQTTARFRGPFADVGRIAELDIPDEAEEVPLPPMAEIALADRAQSDDHFEIDIEELGLGPPGDSDERRRPSSGEIGAPVRVHSIDASAEIDPLQARDEEIARLKAALAAREAEVLRLRDELTRLKEQYLDL